jgi:hypothetical protein
MRHTLLTSLAALAVAAATGCSEPASDLTGVEADAMVASAETWTPADITRDLPVDAATRERIEAAVQTFHASLLALHDRHEAGQQLDGAAREDFMAQLHEDARELHTQHQALWDSLSPEVREILSSRFHAQMHPDDEQGTSLHERMRKMHGGDHGG